MNGANVKKMYTNEILYSLMKEIDKYNEQNSAQKMFQTPDGKVFIGFFYLKTNLSK